MLRLLRPREVVICFAAGHGEYDIDNFAFHTHFEGAQSHSHDAEGTAVVQMEQHGLGRLRQLLEKLGLVARKVTFAAGQPIPDDCAVWSKPIRAPATAPANPTSCAPIWSAAARRCS